MVPTVVVAIVLIILIVSIGFVLFLYYKVRLEVLFLEQYQLILCMQRHHAKFIINISNQMSMEIPKFKLFLVDEESNMIEFAQMNVENYDPDSGNGYYQLTETTEEYISSKTQVVLISKVSSLL